MTKPTDTPGLNASDWCKSGIEITGNTDPSTALQKHLGTRAERLRSGQKRRENLETYLFVKTSGKVQVQLDDFRTAAVDLDGSIPVVKIPTRALEQNATDYDREEFDQIIQYGYADHERGHIEYTPYSYVNSQLSQLANWKQGPTQRLLNALEDGVIEEFLRADNTAVGVRLSTLHANLSAMKFRKIENNSGYFTRSFGQAVEGYILDLGRYDAGLTRLLLDENDSRIEFQSETAEERFRDFRPEIEDVVADVLSSTDPHGRVDRMIEFAEMLFDEIDDPQDEIPDNQTDQRGMSTEMGGSPDTNSADEPSERSEQADTPESANHDTTEENVRERIRQVLDDDTVDRDEDGESDDTGAGGKDERGGVDDDQEDGTESADDDDASGVDSASDTDGADESDKETGSESSEVGDGAETGEGGLEDEHDGEDDGTGADTDADAESEQGESVENENQLSENEGAENSETDGKREDEHDGSEGSSDGAEGDEHGSGENDVDHPDADAQSDRDSAEDSTQTGGEREQDDEDNGDERQQADSDENGADADVSEDDNAPPGLGSDELETDESATDGLDEDRRAEHRAADEQERAIEEAIRKLTRNSDVDMPDSQGGNGLEDGITLVPPSDDFNTDRWEQAESDSQTLMARFEKLLSDQQQDGWKRNQEKGVIDPESIVDLLLGGGRVMRQRVRSDPPKFSVVLMVDRSGSMENEDIECAERASASLALAFEQQGIDVCVMDMHSNTARVANPFEFPVSQNREMIVTGESGGGTPLSDALSVAADRVRWKRGETFVVVITDGEPDSPDAYKDTLNDIGNFAHVLGVEIDLDGSRDRPKYDRNYHAGTSVGDVDELTRDIDRIMAGQAF